MTPSDDATVDDPVFLALGCRYQHTGSFRWGYGLRDGNLPWWVWETLGESVVVELSPLAPPSFASWTRHSNTRGALLLQHPEWEASLEATYRMGGPGASRALWATLEESCRTTPT